MLEIKQTPRAKVAHHSNKTVRPVLRVLRNTAITIIVLAVLLVGIGVVYTWYNGKYGEQPKNTVAVKKTPVVSKGPTKPSPTSKVNASVQLLTSPITPGDNASINVHTNADAKCTIKVEYDKVTAKDSGLVPKTADEFGMVTWAWTVPVASPVGKWPVTVTCANLKNSGMVIGDLIVAKK
jgi:hypothetical protein